MRLFATTRGGARTYTVHSARASCGGSEEREVEIMVETLPADSQRLLRIASRGSAPPTWIEDVCPGTRFVLRTRRRYPALMEEVEGPREGGSARWPMEG